MAFFKKLAGVVGLFLSMNILAGENPQMKDVENLQADTITAKKSTKSSSSAVFYKHEIKLYPRMRIEDIEDELKKIPADAITQFLTLPKVVEEDEIDKLPYIVDFPGEHIIAGAGIRIYVRSILTPKTLDYSIYRKGDPYHNPKNKELLGYEAIYIGNAKLQRAGDPATLMVTKSTQEVRRGDRVMVTTKDESELNYFPKFPETMITGNILNVVDGVSQIGKYNVVAIDKGKVDGLKVGHVLDIYQRGRMIADHINEDIVDEMVQLPDELAGTLMIFRSFKRVSYGLIIKATSAIHVLDKVKTPEYAHLE